MIRRGKDDKKIKAVIALLAKGDILPPKHNDHPLKGNFAISSPLCLKTFILETAVEPPNTPNNAEKTKHYVQK